LKEAWGRLEGGLREQPGQEYNSYFLDESILLSQKAPLK
jgi:hypothetical protein